MSTRPSMAILAGGLATRMGELTTRVPKALIEVEGRPFLAWQLDLLRAHEIRDVVLCVGHHADQIEEWVARHAPGGIRIRFSRDGEHRRGTGGALLNALPLLGETFFVMYGDSYLRCDYQAVYERFQGAARAAPPALGLMTVFANHDHFDVSNVVYRAGTIVRYSKRDKTPEMKHIDWGLGILTREALMPFAQRHPLDLAEVYESLVEAGRLSGYETSERFFEVGSHEGLREFAGYLREHPTPAR